MTTSAVIDWVLAGDVAVEYQATRDLLGHDRQDLRARIAREGVGAALLGTTDVTRPTDPPTSPRYGGLVGYR